MQASIHVSPGGPSSHFQDEVIGDLLMCTITSNQAVRIGNLQGTKSMLTVNSNAAVVDGLLESHNVSTNVVAATALTLTPYSGTSLPGSGGGGGSTAAAAPPTIDATDSLTINTSSDVDVLSNVRATPRATPLWGVSMDGLGDGALARDSDGNLYLTSRNVGVSTAKDSSNAASSITVSNTGGWVTKYSSSGTPIWAASVGIDGGGGYGVAAATDGSVYTAGYYENYNPSIVYNAGNVDSGLTLRTPQNRAAFLIKYDTVGAAQWAACVDGAGGEHAFAVALVGGTGAYLVGDSSSGGSVVYDAGNVPSATTLPAAVDGFLIKYSAATGTAVWAAGVQNGGLCGCASDSAGNVYVAGRSRYGNTTPVIYDASGSPSETVTLPLASSMDNFVIKYSASGVAQWATRVTVADVNLAVAVSEAGGATSVYLAGTYYHATNSKAYSASGVPTSLPPTVMGIAGYIIKYDGSGATLWAAGVDGATGNAVAVDVAKGKAYMGGIYELDAVIYDSAGTRSTTTTLMSPGGIEIGYYVQFDASTGVARTAASLNAASYAKVFTMVASDDVLYVGGHVSNGVMTAYTSDQVASSVRTGTDVAWKYNYIVANDVRDEIVRYKLVSNGLTSADNGTSKTIVNTSSTEDAFVDVRDAGDTTTLNTLTIPKSGSATVVWYATRWY